MEQTQNQNISPLYPPLLDEELRIKNPQNNTTSPILDNSWEKQKKNPSIFLTNLMNTLSTGNSNILSSILSNNMEGRNLQMEEILSNLSKNLSKNGEKSKDQATTQKPTPDIFVEDL